MHNQAEHNAELQILQESHLQKDDLYRSRD